MTQTSWKKIENNIKSGIRRKVFPGAVFSVQRDGHNIYKKAFGHFTYNKASPKVSIQTLYDIASITKIITLTGFLMLIDRKKVNLTDTLESHIKELERTTIGKRTIWNLLTHTSAVNDLIIKNLSKRQLQNILITLKQHPTYGLQGKRVTYGNINSILLGELIKIKSGMPLEVYIKKEVLIPLNMTRTLFKPNQNLKNKIPPTEIIKDKKIIHGIVHDESARILGGVSAHAGLFSNVNDLQKVLSLWMHEGKSNNKQIITPILIKEALRNQTKNLNLNMGYGWFLNDKKKLRNFARNTFSHGGFTGGIIVGSKKKKLTCVFLSNMTFPKRPDKKNKEKFFRSLFNAVEKTTK